jgi:hypothetical protein
MGLLKWKQKLFLGDDFLHAPHGPTFQAYFDPVMMGWGFCQDIFDNPLCQFATVLILFEDDQNGYAGFDVGTGLSIHKMCSL